MKGRFTTGIMAGAMLGTVAGIMATPMLKGSTRRKIAKKGKNMMSLAGKGMEIVVGMMK